jgi:hypothetical protein
LLHAESTARAASASAVRKAARCCLLMVSDRSASVVNGRLSDGDPGSEECGERRPGRIGRDRDKVSLTSNAMALVATNPVMTAWLNMCSLWSLIVRTSGSHSMCESPPTHSLRQPEAVSFHCIVERTGSESTGSGVNRGQNSCSGLPAGRPQVKGGQGNGGEKATSGRGT